MKNSVRIKDVVIPYEYNNGRILANINGLTILFWVPGMPAKDAKKYLYQSYVKKQIGLILDGVITNVSDIKECTIKHDDDCPGANLFGLCKCDADVVVSQRIKDDYEQRKDMGDA